MPRALSREEQAILALVRRGDVAIPVPELAVRLNLAVPVAQAACDYLVSRGLLRAAVYAVEAPLGTKHLPSGRRSETATPGQPRVPNGASLPFAASAQIPARRCWGPDN